MTVENVLKIIEENKVTFVDLRFTDTHGKEQHVTVPVDTINEAFFSEGKMFDGSSIAGWKGIQNSDMCLMAEPDTAVMDPFCDEPTLNLRCDVLEPSTMMGYERDPRSLAKRAEEYLKSTGIADTCFFGPEPEFFIFDDVKWRVDMSSASYQLDSQEAAWNSAKSYEEGNLGHRPSVKGGYFPVPPVDSSQDIRTTMSLTMQKMGLVIEAHHHEVATSNQNEIATKFNTLLIKADELQILKYVVHNVAHAFGKTATFMPKPVVGDNGNGMHVHQSLFKNGENIFAGEGYAGLSDEALYYIGGIIKHARAINAFANSTTNSYKRLVPGFEAPVMLAYSSRNRSAAIRVPFVVNPKGRRLEIRFPDAAGNPYLTFASMMMAGLDGIKNRIHPGDPIDKDLYDLPPEEAKEIPQVCVTFQDALNALNADREFLKEGGVFSDDYIDSYIALKQEQVKRLLMTTHPIEFEMYYSS